MSLTLKSPKSNVSYELPPDGTHPARCVAVIDLGTHTEQFPRQEPFDRAKLMICWELVDAPMSGTIGRNHVVYVDYTASLHEKARLRKDLKSWRGGKDFADEEEFHVSKLLDQPCLITIEHRQSKDGSKTFAHVVNVTAVPRGTTVPKTKLKPFLYEGIEQQIVPDVPVWVPAMYGKSAADKIAECHEWRKGKGNNEDDASPAAGRISDDPDDTPF